MWACRATPCNGLLIYSICHLSTSRRSSQGPHDEAERLATKHGDVSESSCKCENVYCRQQGSTCVGLICDDLNDACVSWSFLQTVTCETEKARRSWSVSNEVSTQHITVRCICFPGVQSNCTVCACPLLCRNVWSASICIWDWLIRIGLCSINAEWIVVTEVCSIGQQRKRDRSVEVFVRACRQRHCTAYIIRRRIQLNALPYFCDE